MRLIYQINDALRDMYCTNRVMPDLTLYVNKKTAERELTPYQLAGTSPLSIAMRWATVPVVESEDIGDGIAIIDAPDRQIVLVGTP